MLLCCQGKQSVKGNRWGTMFTLNGTTEGFRINTPLKVRATLKEDRFILWDYDYTNTRITHTVPIISLKWGHWRRKDNSGKEYEYWYAYTGQKGYDRQEYKLAEIDFQTWDMRAVWIGAKYFNKGRLWVNVSVRFDLDDKSQRLFETYVSSLK